MAQVTDTRPRTRPDGDGEHEHAHDTARLVVPLDELTARDVAIAGGKGANLGELARAGLPVPGGFVVAVTSYELMRATDGVGTRLRAIFDELDLTDPTAVDAACDAARALFVEQPLPDSVHDAVQEAHAELAGEDARLPVIVRSSATLEDSTDASFAGMNRTFANVHGFRATVEAVKACWASQFSPRGVAYRARHGFPIADSLIAVVVQRYVPSRQAGVMFTVDPTGRTGHVVIEASVGSGEAVVSGRVTPDRFLVDRTTGSIVERYVARKELRIDDVPGGGIEERQLGEHVGLLPALDDLHALAIARLGIEIDAHYGSPQDVEWVIDEEDAAWIVQSRPITTLGTGAAAPARAEGVARPAEVVARGIGASTGVAAGRARILHALDEGARLEQGDVLVTRMTAPDWVPIMQRAAAVVTDSGGMTCHAAIVARELGIPCVVGTRSATTVLRDGDVVTVDGGRGVIVLGDASPGPDPVPAPVVGAARTEPASAGPTVTGTRVLVNLSEPSRAASVARLDCDGVGLLRAELMVLEALDGAHPRLLLEEGRGDEFVDRMAESLTSFAAAFSPRPITYRTIDFRSNEFRGLRGGDRFEPVESNPMLGYRGAFRYVREPDLFELELRAIERVRAAGYDNLHVMLPFVRTPHDVSACQAVIRRSQLLEDPGFELWVMAEVPSVVPYMGAYAELGIAGVSIGSNDLTQLVLGVDRDSELLGATYDERDDAVRWFIEAIIRSARGAGLRTSICGQAPSTHPGYVDFLVDAGIDAVSVSADVVGRTRVAVAGAERRLLVAAARETAGHVGVLERRTARGPFRAEL